jgi:YspA, cpYpsA-related SLOG family
MESFKLIIAGGREFCDYALLHKKVDVLLASKRFSVQIEIVSGKAKGADTLGEQYAKANNFSLKEFPADWSIGESAGYLRNKDMAEYADACICFWDGKSKGTKQMIDLAKEKGIPLRIVLY